MRHRSIGSVVGMVVVLAGGARAQAPLTADSVREIAAAMTALTHHAVALSDTERSVQVRAQDLIRSFQEHNTDACEYPPGQPELCASYDMERFALNGRSGDLQKEMRADAASRRALVARFEELTADLRTAGYAPALSRQKTPLVACADGATPSAVAACLRRVIPASTVAGGSRGTD